jgi:tetratricopeptide (TPR) repeat protein
LNNQKKYVEAEEAFRQGVEIAPEHPDILNGLGYALAAQDRYTDAETFAKKALARDSSFANYNLMAYVLIAGEIDIDLGMAFAQKALASKPAGWPQLAEINPHFAIPEHTLGLAYLKKSEYEKAISYLEQAAAFAPQRQAIQDDLQLARQKLQVSTKK